MKKTLKITGIVLVVLFVAALAAPLLLSSKIDSIVKSEASKSLNARLDFEKLSISLIRHFPNASINLKGLSVVGIESFEGDTLVKAKEISVVVNIMSVFGDSGFEVRKILLDQAEITALVNSEGKANWDIVKEDTVSTPEQPTGEASAFKLSLKKMSVKDARVAYLDEQSKMSFYAENIDVDLSGDMSAEKTNLDLKLSSDGLRYLMGKMTMLSGAQASLQTKIEADLKNSKYTLDQSTLTLNAIKVGLEGWVGLAQDGAIDMDMKVRSEKVEFKELLSLIPAFYTKDFKSLTAKGALSVEAWAKGRMTADLLPAFGLGVKVSDGYIKYSDLPKSIDDIQIAASVSSKGGVADNAIIDLSRMSFSIAKNPFSATLYASNPVSDPDFRVTAKGMLNLGMIKEVYPLGDSVSLSGVVKADMSVVSRMSYIEKGLYEKISASGSMSVNDMTARMSGIADLKISKASATIDSKNMSLREFDCTVGGSDFSASGELSNYLAYLLRGDKLTGRLDVKSQLLDLNELMSYQTSDSQTVSPVDTTSLKAPAIPENLDLQLSASLAKITFQQMNITDLSGVLTVRDGILDMKKLDMGLFGGKVSTSGSYSIPKGEVSPAVKMKANITNASFSKTFDELDVVRKIVPLFEKTGGNYSMTLDLSTRLKEDMSAELNTVNAVGELRSSDIHIQNIKALDAMATALKDERIKNIQAKDVKIPFSIENGKISTKPFDIKAGNININLSGTTSLDQSIDYTAVVKLPEGSAGGYLKNVNVLIRGTFSSPKISIDVKNAAKDAITQVINKEIAEKLGSENLSEQITKQAENLRTQAIQAGEKLVQIAKEQGDKLVSQASNPVTKIAAKKSSEVMIKKAQEQAQKLVEEAEKQIEKLKGEK